MAKPVFGRAKPNLFNPRKQNQVKPSVDPPGLRFAIQFEMLSDEEINLVRKGKAEIDGYTLIINRGGSFKKLVHLYSGRKYDLLVKRLLEDD